MIHAIHPTINSSTLDNRQLAAAAAAAHKAA
jgi:hypothetical protein